MMKATLRALTRSMGVIQEAAKSEKRTALASMTLGLLMRAMDPYLRQYQLERTRLLEQYGAPVEGQADLWGFPDPAKRKAFNAENNALLEMEVELAGIAPVPASKWAENGINWAPEALLALEWLIVLDTPTLFDSLAAGLAGHTGPAAG